MKKTKIFFFPLAIAMFLLSGCASYNAFPLETPIIQSCSQKNEDILISATPFNKADCKRYLDRDVLSKGYQPVQLFIQNASDKNYAFSLQRISLSCARPEEVADKVHTDTAGRAAGYGAGAIFLWPLAIPAIVDGVKSSNANEALDNDFSAKTARDQIIPPHSYFNKLIFVPVKEYQSAFTITLMDQESGQLKELKVTAQ